VDTTGKDPRDLRSELREFFTKEDPSASLNVAVYSFGFKHRSPQDADLVIDVRFLPNPYYEPELRPLTGLDEPVQSYVLNNPETDRFLRSWRELLRTVMPGYVNEGKHYLNIAVGCTGGQHRSVVLAEQTASFLRASGYAVSCTHRDLKLAYTGTGFDPGTSPLGDAA